MAVTPLKSFASSATNRPRVKERPRIPDIIKGRNPVIRAAWDQFEREDDDWRKSLEFERPITSEAAPVTISTAAAVSSSGGSGSEGGSTIITGAPIDASYLVLGLHDQLSSERVLLGTPGQIILTDNGPGVDAILSLDPIILHGLSPLTTRGDIMTHDGTGNIRLPIGGPILRSDGTDVSWGQIDLGTDVAGILPVVSGGTGVGALSDVGGTANQVIVVGGTARVIGGNITLSLPQNIDEGASPTFLGTLTVGSLVISTPLAAIYGGTGINTYAQGDILYASSTTALAKLAKNATATRYLSNTGASNNPAWAQIDLSNGVTGDLPFTNIAPSSAASILLGRGDSGTGDFQEIILGSGLTMTGVTLSASGVSVHDMLSATHTDSLAAAVQAGDIIYGNATPKWARLDHPGEGGFFLQTTSDVGLGWAQVSAGDISGILGTIHGGTGIGAVNQGDLLYAPDNIAWAALAKDTTAAQSRYLSNTGTDNNPAWAQINLANGVTGDLPFANITQASAASKLFGRGDSGAGDFQEITLGTGLSMSGTTLNASAAGAPTDATYITLGVHASLSNERVLSGTANQVILTDDGPNDALVLSLPQDIHTLASPLFASLYIDNDGQINLGAAGSIADSGGVVQVSAEAEFLAEVSVVGIVSLTVPLWATSGGTGFASYAVGDILYASTTTALSKLADIATGNALISGGVGVAPSYGKIGLTTHISGTLAVGNGGTGVTSLSNIVGTVNQVSVASGTARVIGGNVTLSLPQDIHTTAAPTFGSLTIGNNGSIILGAAGSIADSASTMVFGAPANTFQGPVTMQGVVTFPDNIRQTFNPGATVAGLNVGSIAGDPSTPINGDLWYDSTANELTARINGASVALGAGATGAPVDAQYVTLIASSTLTNERVLTGTANQIVVTDGGAGAAVTLSTPQNIHTGATPTFASLTLSGRLATEATTPVQITADQSNYAIGDGTFFRLTSDTSRTIHGITGGVNGKRLTIVNAGSFLIIFPNDSATATAANRIYTGTGASFSLGANQMVEMIYDGTTQRWRCGSVWYINVLGLLNGGTGATSFPYGQLLIGQDASAFLTSASLTWDDDFATLSTANLQVGGGATIAKLDYGTYTPTLTNVANVASTAYQCQWMRVGNVVTVSGKVDVDPTLAATSTQLGISLPVASNLGAAEDCAGTAFASGVAGMGAAILGDATNNRAQLQFVSSDINNQSMFFTYQYEVI